MRQPSLAGKQIGDYYHVCAFFDSREQEYRVLSPFFLEGIKWGEKVVHVVDPALIPDHERQLHGHGIDVEACQQCGQLDVLSWDDVYLADGTFDQDRMLAAIEGVVKAGKDAGFERVRIMGNMGWTLKGNPGTESVIEFESRVNEVLSRERQLAVCVYDMAKLSGSMLMNIMRSHPLTLVGDIVHENPFYTPAASLLPELRAAKARRDAPRSNPSPSLQ